MKYLRWIKRLAPWLALLASRRMQQAIEEADARGADLLRREREAEHELEEEAEATLPEPTIWPLVFAIGVMVGLWGIILNTFFFGLGLLACAIAFAGWMNAVLHESHDYLKEVPHEPWKGR